jgi:hypothetical protein
MLGEKDYNQWQMATNKNTAISEAAAAMGRKGGAARAKSLSAKRKREIAENAAEARWGPKKTAGKKKGKKPSKSE